MIDKLFRRPPAQAETSRADRLADQFYQARAAGADEATLAAIEERWKAANGEELAAERQARPLLLRLLGL